MLVNIPSLYIFDVVTRPLLFGASNVETQSECDNLRKIIALELDAFEAQVN